MTDEGFVVGKGTSKGAAVFVNNAGKIISYFAASMAISMRRFMALPLSNSLLAMGRTSP
jgi:hypothetical protein